MLGQEEQHPEDPNGAPNGATAPPYHAAPSARARVHCGGGARRRLGTRPERPTAALYMRYTVRGRRLTKSPDWHSHTWPPTGD